MHFMHYWMRFLLAIWIELPYYAWVRDRKVCGCVSVYVCDCECVSMSRALLCADVE